MASDKATRESIFDELPDTESIGLSPVRCKGNDNAETRFVCDVNIHESSPLGTVDQQATCTYILY